MTADINARDGQDIAILAAELALGLHGKEAYEAALRDPTMRAAIEIWENDLADMAESLPDRPPDPRLWQAVQAQMAPRPPLARRLLESLALWRMIAGGAVAASLALLLLPRGPAPVPVARPEIATEVPQGLLVASLRPREGAALYVGVYHRPSRQLVMVATNSDPVPGYHRLWLVPDDVGEPVDLGLLRMTGETIVTIEASLAAAMTPASGLVVTLEPGDAPPARDARGEVQAHGKLRDIPGPLN